MARCATSTRPPDAASYLTAGWGLSPSGRIATCDWGPSKSFLIKQENIHSTLKKKKKWKFKMWILSLRMGTGRLEPLQLMTERRAYVPNCGRSRSSWGRQWDSWGEIFQSARRPKNAHSSDVHMEKKLLQTFPDESESLQRRDDPTR